jgi:hypothetical protein
MDLLAEAEDPAHCRSRFFQTPPLHIRLYNRFQGHLRQHLLQQVLVHRRAVHVHPSGDQPDGTRDVFTPQNGGSTLSRTNSGNSSPWFRNTSRVRVPTPPARYTWPFHASKAEYPTSPPLSHPLVLTIHDQPPPRYLRGSRHGGRRYTLTLSQRIPPSSHLQPLVPPSSHSNIPSPASSMSPTTRPTMKATAPLSSLPPARTPCRYQAPTSAWLDRRDW